MSLFSQLLNNFIHSKNIRVYSLAEYCEIDPSLIYKILHGKRSISSIQTVNKIATYLRLTPEEFQEFSTAYAIESQGYENFYRRKDILEFLNNFKQTTNISTINATLNTTEEYDTPEEYDTDTMLLPLNNASEVNQAVLNVIVEQIEKGHGQINMMVRTDYPFLINLITSTAHHCTDLKINHIICLNSTEQMADHKSFNLHCLINILPLCTCGCFYVPYYYYDNSVPLHSLRLFPYVIMTDCHAVILSESLQTGFVTNQKDFLNLVQIYFEKYKMKTRMLLNKLNSISEQIEYIQNSFSQHSSSEYCMQMIPCLTDLLTPAILERYINHSIHSRTAFLKELKSYISKLKQHYINNNVIYIFSEEGVREFLETGILEEYSRQLYSPINLSDRLLLIKRMIKKLNIAPQRMKMLRYNIGTTRNGVSIYITSQIGYLLFTPVGYDSPIWLDIRESGLLSAFLDFFEHMPEDMFYSVDETRQILKNVIKEFSLQLKTEKTEKS